MNRTGRSNQRQGNRNRPAGKGSAPRPQNGGARRQQRQQGGSRPQANRRPVQRPLTEEEIRRRQEARARREEEMARRAEEIARRREEAVRRKIALRQMRKKQFRRMMVLTGQRFVIFLAMFLLLLGMSTGIFFLRLHTGNHTEPVEYLFRLGNAYDKENRLEFRRPDSALYFGNVLYLNALEVADFLGFTTAGDVHSLRLLLNNDAGDEAVFTMGSNAVELNGIIERISAAPFYRNGIFYLPADFFTRYVSGVEVIEDAEKAEVTLAAALTGECREELAASLDEDGRLVGNVNFAYEPMNIRVKESQPSEVIKENSLSEEILLSTDMEYVTGLSLLRKEMAAAILAAPDEEKLTVREEYEDAIEEFRLKRLLAIQQEIAENQLGLNSRREEDMHNGDY